MKMSLASQIRTRLFKNAHILAIRGLGIWTWSAKNLLQIAHLFEYLSCDTICENTEPSGEDADEAGRKIR